MKNQVTVYGTEWCGSTVRARRQLEQAGVGYTFIDIEEDEQAGLQVEKWENGKRRVPQVLIEAEEGAKRLSVPSARALDEELDRSGLLQKSVE